MDNKNLNASVLDIIIQKRNVRDEEMKRSLLGETVVPTKTPIGDTEFDLDQGLHKVVPTIGLKTNHALFQMAAAMDPFSAFSKKKMHENYEQEIDAFLAEVTLIGSDYKTDGGKPMAKSSLVVKVGQTDPLLQGNLHKKIHLGLRKADEEMAKETPQERKIKAKESKKILDDFASKRGFKKMSSLLNGNGKTEKSTGEGVSTIGFAAAPHSTSGLNGFDVCPRSSSECRKNCLGTETGGNKMFPDAALSSKIIKTHALAAHPEHFHRVLNDEIESHKTKARGDGYIPGVRLNVTSDFSWEKHIPNTIKRHKDVQFYDYTKADNRVGHPDLPANYHLSLSHTGTGHAESNDKHAINKLEKGHVVAMVYQKPIKAKGKETPEPTHVEDVKTGKRYPIINGDNDDNTFDRHNKAKLHMGKTGHGVVSGLKLKGVTAKKAGHFANKVDPDGIIRINKG